jgi:antitoxin (DNA-binding transcriptional repressor) of toxin-antitoxin stability system
MPDSLYVSKSLFKAKALEFFRQVEAEGQSLVITDHGKPVLELRPYREAQRDPLSLLKGSLLKYEQPLEPVGDDWESA